MIPGNMLLNYEIGRELGRGGCGTVYLARDVNLDLEVAIKVLRDENLRNSMMLHRMLVGARAAAHLRHPHIQLIYYQGIDPATKINFVAMEYLPGGSLRQRLQASALSILEALQRFAEICEGVDYAHCHGVIHRDLKPDNILFDRDDRLVVTDFDLARIAGSVQRTQEGQMMGTPQYISPEQAVGSPTNLTTDIYALGVMLFEMVSGQKPFVGDTAEIIDQHLRAPPPAVRQINPEVPERVEAAVMRAMAKQPAERYQSAWEMACAVTGRDFQPKGEIPVSVQTSSDQYAKLARPLGTTVIQGAPISQAVIQASLRVAGGPGASVGQEFYLGEGVSIGYGRKRNDLHLDDDYVSRAHARIDHEGGAYLLQDLNSKNGTSVNGEKLAPYEPYALSPGDEIEFGDTRLIFQV